VYKNFTKNQSINHSFKSDNRAPTVQSIEVLSV